MLHLPHHHARPDVLLLAVLAAGLPAVAMVMAVLLTGPHAHHAGGPRVPAQRTGTTVEVSGVSSEP